MSHTFIVHSYNHARAAAAAAVECDASLTLLSAPAAAGSAGPAWFAALVRAIRAEFPGLTLTAILDCGTAPGFALAALREGGIDAVRLIASKTVLAKVAAIAQQSGVCLDKGGGGGAMDLLGVRDLEAACLAHLADVIQNKGARHAR